MKILIIDDEADLFDYFENLISNISDVDSVKLASSIEEARSQIVDADIILADVHFDGANKESYEALLSSVDNKVIRISGGLYDAEENIPYLCKPFTSSELLEAIEKLNKSK